jgi:RHS repeat-associated protein
MSSAAPEVALKRSLVSLLVLGAFFGVALITMTLAWGAAALASPGAVTVNSASIDRVSTNGKLSYSVSASASGYWLANNTGTCIGNGSCTLTLQTQMASSVGTLASTTATGSESGFSHTFSGSVAMTQITAVRLVLTGGGGTITGSWSSVSDPYPTPVVSVSVASLGRSGTTGQLTWDITATASNYTLLDSACPSNSSYTCYLRIEGKRVDGSTVQLAQVSNLYNQPYPYVFQSVSSLTVTQITDVRARVFRTSSPPPDLVGSWVAVSDPYPTPTAVVTGTVGRDIATGKLTWDLTATASNFALLDSACPSNSSYACYLRIEGRHADGSIVQLAQVSDLYGKPYPYVLHSNSSLATTAITDVRVRVFRTSSAPPDLVGAWVAVSDPYPTPSAVVTGTIGRDALTGKLTWDLTATASAFALLDSACPSNSNSTCYLRIEARRLDGSTAYIAEVSSLYGAASPYEFHSVGSMVITEITDIRARVYKNSGPSTPLIGWWEEFEDPYPVPGVMLEGSVGRDAMTGRFAWDLTATASNFSLYDSACPAGHSGPCDFEIEGRKSDGSIVLLARVSDLMTSSTPHVPTANPYVFHSTGTTFNAGTYTDIRATVTKNTLGTTTPLRGDWIPIRDAQGKFFVGGGNASMKGCQCSHADPVNTLNGDFYLPSTDIGLPGVGPAVEISRTYSSLKSASNGPFGYGWSANFTTKLTLGSGTPLPSYVDVVQENGAITTFNLKNGEYPSDPWVLATLTRDSGSGEWTFVRDHRETFVFDSAGLLLETSDVHGTTVTYGRNGSGQVTSIAGTGGREINLTWTSGRVTGISDSAGRTATFAYDGNGNLATATGVDGAVWTHGYDSLHLMTTLTSPEGGVTANVFDATRRAVSQTDPIGRVTTFAYGTLSTTTTFPGGSQTTEKYDQGNVVQQTQATGTGLASTLSYDYDDEGNLVATTDALGNATTSTFDSAGNALTTTDKLNRTTARTFDSLGNVLSVEDPLGRVTEMTYSSEGELESLESPAGYEQVWDYNSDGTVSSHTDARGRTTTYTYDTAGLVLCTTDPALRESCLEYDSRGFIASSVDSAGAETAYTYDALGRELSVTDANDAEINRMYDSNGNLLSIVDAEGNVTNFVYDPADQLLSSESPIGGVTTYAYSPRGEIASVTNPNNDTSTSTYDDLNRVSTVTDGEGRTTTFEYDLAGRLLTTTRPSTAVTSVTYDDAGQVVRSTDARGQTTSYVYDAGGQVVLETDPLGRETESTYTLDGLVETVVYHDASVESHEYNANGQETSFTNADDEVTTYVYGDSGLLDSKMDPGGLETKYSYDAAGRLDELTTPDGHVSSRDYDDAGYLIHVDYAGNADDVDFTYDDAGRRVAMSDASGTTTYTYTDSSKVASVENGHGETIGYSYDDAGQLETVTYPGGHDVVYQYDSAGQMISVAGWATGSTEFSYTPDGYLEGRTDPNGVIETREYDAGGLPTRIAASAGSAVLSDYEYGYDDAGQLVLTTLTDALHSGTIREWGYDAVGQLTTTGSAAYSTSSAGLIATTPEGDELAYNEAGQLASLTNVTAETIIEFTYNDNGARIGRDAAIAGGPHEVVSYEYDELGNLRALSDGSHDISYTSDGGGLRQSQVVDSATRQFLWDTVSRIPVLLDDDEHTYVYGPGSTPIAQIGTGGVVEYLYADNVGSPRVISNSNGLAVGTIDFGPYGLVSDIVGDGRTEIGYTGAWTDQLSGLVYLRARDYDPLVGQFTSVDPLVDQTAFRYAYAANNPLAVTDPLGLCPGVEGTRQDQPCVPSDFFSWGHVAESIGQQYFYYLSGASDGVGFNVPMLFNDNFCLYGDEPSYWVGNVAGVAVAAMTLGLGAAERDAMLIGSRMTVTSSLPALRTTTAQLGAKFKHAPDFGVTANKNTAGINEFRDALESFVSDSATVRAPGTYRNDSVILNYNPSTSQVVIQSPAGDFISGWRMSPEQLRHVVERRSL